MRLLITVMVVACLCGNVFGLEEMKCKEVVINVPFVQTTDGIKEVEHKFSSCVIGNEVCLIYLGDKVMITANKIIEPGKPYCVIMGEKTK